MSNYIDNPVKIRFDPEDPTSIKDKIVGRVFRDKLARTLWLGIKARHIVSTKFHQQCLDVSEELRLYRQLGKDEYIDSPEGLSSILRRHFGCGYNHPDFVRELFPYIVGQKTLEYKVKVVQKTQT